MIIIKKQQNNNLLENVKRTEQLLSSTKFINWFNGSKVVDDDGDPLICYHGTKNVFNTFNVLSHFGTKNAANSFVKSEIVNSQQHNITPVYLSIKNPLKITDEDNYSNDLGFDLWKNNHIDFNELLHIYGDTLILNNETVKLSDYIINVITDLKQSKYKITKKPNIPLSLKNKGYKIRNDILIKILRKKGYDGFVYKNTSEDVGSISWIIFNSNQVWPIFKNYPDKEQKEYN